MPRKEIKIGGLYYVFNQENKKDNSITICNILSFPKIKHEDLNNKPEILGRVVQNIPFVAIEIGPDINPFHRMYGDYYPMWLKILYKETIGWIKIDSDRINEYK
jgi:hypothetical protein